MTGDPAGGPRGRPSRNSVVDHDHGPAGYVHAFVVPAKAPDPPLELGPFPLLDHGDLLFGDARIAHHGRVQDPSAFFPYGPHPQLGLEGDSEFSDHYDVQGGIERPCHLEPDGDASSR